MDDSPRSFFEELRSGILKKRIGQIALAVVLAEALWRLVIALNWYLLIPLIGRALQGHSESVLFPRQTQNPIPWDSLAGSFSEFGLTIVLVFYLNRWIRSRPQPTREEESVVAPEEEAVPALEDEPLAYNGVGEPVRLSSQVEDK